MVAKLKTLKPEKVVKPLLEEFMKTVYNEKDIKASEIKFKSGKIRKVKAKTKDKGLARQREKEIKSMK